MPTDAMLLRLVAAAAALAPAAALLVFFSVAPQWRQLRSLVWISFGLGFSVALPIAAIASLYSGLIAEIGNPRLYAAAVAFLEAALPEEAGKFLVVLFFLMRHEDLRKPVDAAVLTVMVSLGFAAIENLHYVFGSHDWTTTALLRALTAVPMHATVGLVMGAFAARCLSAPRMPSRILVPMLLVPVALHGIYNYPVFATQRVLDTVQPLPEDALVEFQIIFVFAVLSSATAALLSFRSLGLEPTSNCGHGVRHGHHSDLSEPSSRH